MSTNRISIKSIVLGIIGIAIAITIGFGIAKANVAKARVSLKGDHGPQSALLHVEPRAELKELLKSASLKNVKLNDQKLGALDALEGQLLLG